MRRGEPGEGRQSSTSPRVTFGIIVLNGEPYTRYCLRSLYPYAHEIIVVEGGHENTRAVTTSDGHSTDDTLSVLQRFKADEDPLDKVQIVTRDGFWPQKDELGNSRTPQCRAYSERATGEYLWQVDIDEFYRPQDMERVLGMLREDETITQVSFNPLPFWGGFDYVSDGWYWRRTGFPFHRLWKWGPGYSYVTHQPPLIRDDRGRNVRSLHWIDGDEMQRQGIRMYHYDHLLPEQVRQKALIYRWQAPRVCSEILEWAERSYFTLEDPYHVERHYWLPAWIERFKGAHPPEAVRMLQDIKDGLLDVELRPTDDIEALLSRPSYWAGRQALKLLDPVDRFWRWAKFMPDRARNAPRRLSQALGRTAK